MWQQIVAVTAAVLLVVLFLALWLSNLPGLPAVPYRAERPSAHRYPDSSAAHARRDNRYAHPVPDPYPYRPADANSTCHAGTHAGSHAQGPRRRRPNLRPRRDPISWRCASQRIWQTIYGPPVTVVSGSTLPWSIVELIYSSSAFPERDVRIQADADGNYAGHGAVVRRDKRD